MQTFDLRTLTLRFARGLWLVLAALFAMAWSPRVGAAPFGLSARSNLTLLTYSGGLTRKISDAEIAQWKRQLQRGRQARAMKAQLHLWLGEIEIVRHQEPERALEQFRLAQRLSRPSDPIYGCAAFDRAITLFRHGAYAAADSAFHDLLGSKTVRFGYSYISCLLWYRHAATCAGYHAQRAKLGITEPPRLDPRCGVASLAACLQEHGKPCDKRTLLSHCRVTGLGNSMQDLMDCAKRLGMSGGIVRTDEAGLRTLPKPLVAYVEQDHFVAVTRADQDGVSYLCSDCGAWPGGRRDLTWKQWRAMDCAIYLVVTPPGSPIDNALRLLRQQSDLQAASAWHGARLAGSGVNNASTAHAWAVRLLGAHTVLRVGGAGLQCVGTPWISPCPSGQCSCPMDGGGPGGGYSGGGGPPPPPSPPGPSAGEPVDLAAAQEEYHPAPDLTVYNPIGPSVVWQRQYASLRLPAWAGFLGLGQGWNTGYDLAAVINGSGVNLTLPNGSIYLFSTPGTPTASNPTVACPSATPGVPMLCSWNYNADGSNSFVVTRTDRSQWVFSSLNSYGLTQLVDRNGNYITFSYTGSPAVLAAISDSLGHPLLTIRRDGYGHIISVSDRYSHSVYYKVNRFWSHNAPVKAPPYFDDLTQVSQVVRTGTLAPPFRYRLGYTYIAGDYYAALFMDSITVPSPTGKGVSTATVSYNDIGFVSSVRDGNGNTRTYTTAGNGTSITVTDHVGNVVSSYTVNYDNYGRTLSRTDGTNQTLTYQASYAGNGSAVYSGPTQETDGNNNITTYSYDPYGQVLSKTSPRDVTTTYTRDYSVFSLGELKQIQEGSKSPTSYAYYHNNTVVSGVLQPNGLLQSVTTPTPGTSAASGGVTTFFTYDSLGNITSIQRPGNGAVTSLVRVFGYTQDGAYSQPPALGQPLNMTDTSGHITHFRYDAQGNRVAMIDAIGNQTDFRYNIANQQTKTIAPAIGDITNQIGVTRSTLTYHGATKTYNGTLTLTNTGSQAIQGYLLAALTNLAPGVTLANASGTYVNSPALLSSQINLGAGGKTKLNVSFSAPSANAVFYGVQTYLTNSLGNPLVQGAVTQSLYLYPGGPLTATQIYDETGALYRQIGYGYGKEGELLSRSGSAEPVTYTYDAAYRLSTLADGNGNATKYAYNTAGWLASVTYPMGDGQQYPSYDPNGNILKRIDGRGIETDYTYNDTESKLTNVAYVNNANFPNVSQYNVSIDYDGYGRTQDVYDVSGHTHLDYDDLNTQTEIDTTYVGANGNPLPTVSLTYGFNPDGSRNAMSGQIGSASYTWNYVYDTAECPKSLTTPFNETTQWSYLDNNWLASQQYANGVTSLYSADRRGLLNDLTFYAPIGSPLSDFGAMVYDAVGNRLTKVVSIPGALSGYSGQAAYTYDFKDQLIQEQSTLQGGYAENFNYDPAGNPLSFKGQTNTFNADNQFTDSSFAFDGEGNPTSYADSALAFDPEDHMTSFGTALTAGYSYDGLRAWKEGSGGRTYFLYDNFRPVLEMDANGNVTAVNTFGTNGLLSRHTNSESIYYACDPQGNVSQSLDGSANSLATSAFDAFGTGSTSSATPFGYGGQWGYYTDDELGAQLLGHREYAAFMGRFLTRDRIGYKAGVNLYSYVQNSPVSQSDPSGLVTCDSQFNKCLAWAGAAAIVCLVSCEACTEGLGTPACVKACDALSTALVGNCVNNYYNCTHPPQSPLP